MKIIKTIFKFFIVIVIIISVHISLEVLDKKNQPVNYLKKVYLRENLITGKIKVFDEKPIKPLPFIYKVTEYNKSIILINVMLNEKLNNN